MRRSTPIHQWTHDGDKVLLVKCVRVGGEAKYRTGLPRPFVWPKTGIVTDTNWGQSRNSGFYGFPWGLKIDGGRPCGDCCDCCDWIVFASDPASVISIGPAMARAGPTVEVVFYGQHWSGALQFVKAGRDAWLEHQF